MQLALQVAERALLELEVGLLAFEGVALVREVGPHRGELVGRLLELLARVLVAARDRAGELLASRELHRRLEELRVERRRGIAFDVDARRARPHDFEDRLPVRFERLDLGLGRRDLRRGTLRCGR